MPRPTPAQIAYGSATVVFSALAMLLFAQPGAGFGTALIALVSLALGLLVAVTVPVSRTTGRVPRGEAAGAREQRAPLPAEPRVGEHSLHR
ncbi:hypothetical protein [Streptomyces albireticuli]|uniref:hypothetical protein n=1 Tax=Streptomyces albireticuli TaxID=1940 RepID=UPI0036BBCABE